MGDEQCLLEASVTDEEIQNGNSPLNGSDNFKIPLAKQQEEGDGKGAGLWSPSFDEVSGDSDIEELCKNIPELKDIFHIKCKIGEGTFSNVYLAHLLQDSDELFALKYIIPTSAPARVEREVRCLQQMGGTNNVIGYKGTIRNCDHSAVILPYFPHDKFQDYLYDMTVSDIQDYMKNLFQALHHIHCFSIIHRDVKPGNFLHSRKSRRYNLVDFGLAMHEPGSEKAWDMEKKKDENGKKVNRKNVRLLSPESCKTGQASKKVRISPRVSLPSHKLTRQVPSTTTKSLLKNLMKQGSEKCSNTLTDVSSKHSNQVTKLVPKRTSCQEKSHSGKSSLSSKSTSGLCATHHKKIDVCSFCMKRYAQNAPRAGTSGFRAPEVLMKHPHQTTAVDIWSAGVIMLCLLSGRYPFFRCFDDMTALAQIVSLFGKQRVMDSSKHLGKYMVSNSDTTGFDLKNICQQLRLAMSEDEAKPTPKLCCKNCNKMKTTKKERTKEKESSPGQNTRGVHSRTSSVSANISSSSSNENTKVRFLSTGHSPQTQKTEISTDLSVRQHLDGARCTCICGSCSGYVPTSAYNLLEKCLDLNPSTRITAAEALRHPFLSDNSDSNISSGPER